MNREQFLEYVDHFNNHRFDRVVGYFCPDVTLAYPDNFMGPQIPGVTGNTLHGPHHIRFFDKGHFQVDLGKFRLAVRA